MPTIKLYDEDAYMKEFTATVVSIEKNDKGQAGIVLDRTAFFPEAGGQSADVGELGDFKVVDVQINGAGVITHFCVPKNAPADGGQGSGAQGSLSDSFSPENGTALPAVGEAVRGAIDWERRHTLMQHHTGEHLFSGIVHRDFGYDNVGFHLSDHICTMDYNGTLSEADVARIETECNEWIYKNAVISCDYPDDAALAGLDYRCKGELVPPIRIVTIAGADVCACCAPHVHTTGEIGTLKVLEAKSYKGGIRLTIVCGRKAFADYRNRFRLLAEASHLLSSHYENLPERILRLQDEKYALKAKISSLQEERLRQLIANATGEDSLFFVEDVDTKSIRSAVNALMDTHSGLCGIFCGNDPDGYSFILGSAVRNMQDTASLLRQELKAKCGGSEKMIQGQVHTKREAIERLLAEASAFST
ncbi:MAG: hypothetical protein IJ682_01990 [Lachnospiraceae bacterium]|nr:hypothetical protein [Lachnospiraceae bacterium]